MKQSTAQTTNTKTATEGDDAGENYTRAKRKRKVRRDGRRSDAAKEDEEETVGRTTYADVIEAIYQTELRGTLTGERDAMRWAINGRCAMPIARLRKEGSKCAWSVWNGQQRAKLPTPI